MALRPVPSPRRGATALEFVLALPVFLMVVLGVAEISAFMSAQYDLQRAARDGARVGSITLEGLNPDGDEIEANAIAQAKLVLAATGRPCLEGCAVSAEWFELEDGYHYVAVDVAQVYRPLTPGLRLVPATAGARFVMLAQQQ